MEQKIEKIVKINLESRISNEKTSVEIMRLKYKKISFWEYGYNLEPTTSEEIYGLQMDVYKIKENSIKVRLSATKKNDSYIAINKRGQAVIDFGYNSSGDYIIIENEGEKVFNFNQINKVFLTSLDSSHDNLKYYWGRELNKIKGYLDKSKQTPFYIYVEKN